jgi:NADH-quinone oxidoreductase subunit J
MEFTFADLSFCVLKYLFLFSPVCVLLNVQTIYAVFCLILAFLSAAFLFILGGATFIGFILIVVYVGAVLIFFLFVTMMLNIRTEVKFNFVLFSCISFVLSILLGVDILGIMYLSNSTLGFDFLNVLNFQSNIVVIGYVLYTWYAVPLILCSFVLLVSMIGAIVLLVDITCTSQGAYSGHFQDIATQVQSQDFLALELSSTYIYHQLEFMFSYGKFSMGP